MSLSDSNLIIQIPYFWEVSKKKMILTETYGIIRMPYSAIVHSLFHWCQFVSKFTYGIYNTDYSKQ